jgi:hypothetical protein
MNAVLEEMGATTEQREAFELHRRRVHPENRYSRTFVITFAHSWTAAIHEGEGMETALSRAMVNGTRMHYLAVAVAQGIRPARGHMRSRPPRHLSEEEQLEFIANEIHTLSGIKPPIDAHVLAVAMGLRLTPTYGDGPDDERLNSFGAPN